MIQIKQRAITNLNYKLKGTLDVDIWVKDEFLQQ